MILNRKPSSLQALGNMLTVFVLILTTIGCAREVDNVSDRLQKQLEGNRAFQPLAIGTTWVYQIDSIYYVYDNNKLLIDSVFGIYRETIVDTFHNTVGNPVYRIIREKEDKLQNQWVKIAVSSIEDFGTRLVKTEGNIPLIDLTFPLKRFSQWDATALIDGYEPFYIKSRELPIYKDWGKVLVTDSSTQVILGQDRTTLTIRDIDSDDGIILSQYSTRQYAKGIGMTYKEQAFFTTQRIELADLPWREKADVGFEMKQTLIRFN